VHPRSSWLMSVQDGLGVVFDDCYQNLGRVH